MATLVAISAMTTGAHAASEAPTVLYNGKYWQTRYYASNSGGHQMCLTVGAWNFAGGATGMAMIKWTKDTGAFIHIGKSSWKFADNIDVPMSISLDSKSVAGEGVTSNGNLIGITLAPDFAPKFLADFAEANSMVITFKSGNERPWKAEMSGSREAMVAFGKCVAYIGGAAPTSPVPNAGTSPVPSKPQASSPVPNSGAKKRDNGSI